MKVAGVSAESRSIRLCGGMQPHLQRVEGKRAFDRNDQFAVEHKGLRGEGTQVFQHLGKEARERFSGFGLDLDLIARAKSKAAKAVPLGLVLPAGIFGQLADQLGFHGLKIERDAERGQSSRPLPGAVFIAWLQQACGSLASSGRSASQ